MSALTTALVGKFVHFIERCEHDGVVLKHQGKILAVDGERLLCNLTWPADDCGAVQGLITIDELVGAFIYPSATMMLESLASGRFCHQRHAGDS